MSNMWTVLSLLTFFSSLFRCPSSEVWCWGRPQFTCSNRNCSDHQVKLNCAWGVWVWVGDIWKRESNWWCMLSVCYHLSHISSSQGILSKALFCIEIDGVFLCFVLFFYNPLKQLRTCCFQPSCFIVIKESRNSMGSSRTKDKCRWTWEGSKDCKHVLYKERIQSLIEFMYVMIRMNNRNGAVWGVTHKKSWVVSFLPPP